MKVNEEVNEMNRIQLKDTGQDILIKMANGNPGAISAMVSMIENGKTIDPDSIFGPLGAIISLDIYKIYGTDIYILWNDICEKDISKVLMLLRATNFGFFPESKLKEMTHDQTRSINISKEDWDKLLIKLRIELPNFAKLN